MLRKLYQKFIDDHGILSDGDGSSDDDDYDDMVMVLIIVVMVMKFLSIVALIPHHASMLW